MGVSNKNPSVALKNFLFDGEIIKCEPYGNGHINSTFLVECEGENGKKSYVLQAINGFAFKQPKKVIDNIWKVTEFLRNKNPNERQVVSMIPTVSGENYFCDDEGDYWRVYTFINDSVCIESPENTEQFKQCALAFGRFQRDLDGFPAEELFETIVDFHNTVKRYQNFLKAVDEDVCGRVAGVQKEIEFVKARADFYSVLLDANKSGKLPLRVTHNDTKANNVLLDSKTQEALCVIDLDTIMPGFSVNDFGDAIRFGANTAAEDEKDLSKVKLDMNLFEAYTEGFLEGCGELMSKDEVMLLPEGAKMMTIECGMRFLTDYLSGDTYFRTAYPNHNLDRCRTQFKLVKEMEEHWQEMKTIVNKYIK